MKSLILLMLTLLTSTSLHAQAGPRTDKTLAVLSNPTAEELTVLSRRQQ